MREYQYKPWNLSIYFSFSTLTTLGYGDIIPIDRWVMFLANMEAVLGSFYLAIMVARLVSIYDLNKEAWSVFFTEKRVESPSL